MNIRKPALVVCFALITAATWIFGFGLLHNLVYQALGSPVRPTRVLWVAFLAQSFAMGAMPGALMHFIDGSRGLSPSIIFVLVIFISIITTAAIIGGKHIVLAQMSEYGTWFFLAGAAVGCIGSRHVRSDT